MISNKIKDNYLAKSSINLSKDSINEGNHLGILPSAWSWANF